MTAVVHSFGWRRQRLDARDRKFAVTRRIALPSSADLRPGMPPVYDQGSLGSCTAHAAAALFEFARIKAKADLMPSRLHIYYHERLIEGTVKSDAGAELRDAAKVLGKVGVCPEAAWPYVVSKFATKPPATTEKVAAANRASSYTSVDNTNVTALKTVLASGNPLMFGFTVYDSFESDKVARTGLVPMPKLKTEKILGGHAVVLCGYDDKKKRFLVRNSWGPTWSPAMAGYCWFPYAYLTDGDLSSDFWTITL